MTNDTTWPFISTTPVLFPGNAPIMYRHSVHCFCLYIFHTVIHKSSISAPQSMDTLPESGNGLNIVSCLTWIPVCLFTCRSSFDCTVPQNRPLNLYISILGVSICLSVCLSICLHFYCLLSNPFLFDSICFY